MADTPEAAGAAPAQTEANQPIAPETPQAPQTPQAPEAPQVPDMHGFTSEDLADMRKFFDSQGGYDKIKSRISNPEKYSEKSAEAPQAPSAPQNDDQPTSHTQQPVEAPQTPQGAITPQEFLAQQYFKSLAGEEKYAPIAEQISSGDVLREMAKFNIRALNQDGSINDQMVRNFLDLKAQTVPAKPTETQPNDSAAPTVDYVEVGDQITSLEQAYQVIMQPGHPDSGKADEYIKSRLNANSENK